MPTTEISLTQTKRALWLGMKFSDIVELGIKAAEKQLIDNIEKQLAEQLADKIETALSDGHKRFDVSLNAQQGQYLATMDATIAIDFHQNGFEIIEDDCISFGLNNKDDSPEAIEREEMNSLIEVSRIWYMAENIVEW